MTTVRGMDGRASGSLGSCGWCGRPVLPIPGRLVTQCSGCRRSQVACVCATTVSGDPSFDRTRLDRVDVR